MLRVRTTPQGYTHDWEVFVRGIDNADIHHYVEKGKYNSGGTLFLRGYIMTHFCYIVL